MGLLTPGICTSRVLEWLVNLSFTRPKTATCSVFVTNFVSLSISHELTYYICTTSHLLRATIFTELATTMEHSTHITCFTFLHYYLVDESELEPEEELSLEDEDELEPDVEELDEDELELSDWLLGRRDL